MLRQKPGRTNNRPIAENRRLLQGYPAGHEIKNTPIEFNWLLAPVHPDIKTKIVEVEANHFGHPASAIPLTARQADVDAISALVDAKFLVANAFVELGVVSAKNKNQSPSLESPFWYPVVSSPFQGWFRFNSAAHFADVQARLNARIGFVPGATSGPSRAMARVTKTVNGRDLYNHLKELLAPGPNEPFAFALVNYGMKASLESYARSRLAAMIMSRKVHKDLDFIPTFDIAYTTVPLDREEPSVPFVSIFKTDTFSGFAKEHKIQEAHYPVGGSLTRGHAGFTYSSTKELQHHEQISRWKGYLTASHQIFPVLKSHAANNENPKMGMSSATRTRRLVSFVHSQDDFAEALAAPKSDTTRHEFTTFGVLPKDVSSLDSWAELFEETVTKYLTSLFGPANLTITGSRATESVNGAYKRIIIKPLSTIFVPKTLLVENFKTTLAAAHALKTFHWKTEAVEVQRRFAEVLSSMLITSMRLDEEAGLAGTWKRIGNEEGSVPLLARRGRDFFMKSDPGATRVRMFTNTLPDRVIQRHYIVSAPRARALTNEEREEQRAAEAASVAAGAGNDGAADGDDGNVLAVSSAERKEMIDLIVVHINGKFSSACSLTSLRRLFPRLAST